MIELFLNGFKIIPDRIECLFYLAEYYLVNQDILNAYKTIKVASKIKFNEKYVLFCQKNIYDYRLKELTFGLYEAISDTNTEIPGLTKEQIKTNSDELYKFLTENPIVPLTVVQKVIAFRNQKNLKDIVMLDEYDFYPNFDTYGNDIGHFPFQSIEELAEIAELYPDCVGFNSWGYLKNKINPKDQFIHLANQFHKQDGLFVKKSYQQANTNKEEKINYYPIRTIL